MLVNGESGELISIRDRGLLYGDGVFRTIRAVAGQLQHLPLHFEKLQHDCAELGIACPALEMLARESSDLLERHGDGIYKLIVTRGVGPRGYAPPENAQTTHIWDYSPAPNYPSSWKHSGIRLHLCKMRLTHQPRLAGIKHLNRLENVLAASEWCNTDFAEGLLMDPTGKVIEATRSNVFLVSHGILVTPQLSNCGVAGVQRGRVLSWALQHKMPLQVRDVQLDEIWAADELFLVNSVIGLWSVCELEVKFWTDFPVAMKIRHNLEGSVG